MLKQFIFQTSKWILTIMVLGAVGFIVTVRSPQYKASLSTAQTLARAPASTPLRAQYCTDLHTYTCKSTGVTKDPTGSVDRDIKGEIRALRLYQRIVRKNPTWTREQIDEQVVRELFTPKRKRRITAAYDYAKKAVERYLRAQPDSVFTAREKRMLLTKVSALRLELPPPAMIYADEPDLYTRSDVIYERLSDGVTRIRVGGAFLLSVSSWYNLVFSFAHEIAHAIDPCELRAQHIAIPAYDRLSACFIKRGIVKLRPDRLECSHNDQLSESFSDWLAAHVSAEALTTFATEFDDQRLLSVITNSVRDLCEEDHESPDYPSPSLRVKNLFGLHPKIRSLLGCVEDAQTTKDGPYCDWNFTADGHP